MREPDMREKVGERVRHGQGTVGALPDIFFYAVQIIIKIQITRYTCN
jgi:hypothetical protein